MNQQYSPLNWALLLALAPGAVLSAGATSLDEDPTEEEGTSPSFLSTSTSPFGEDPEDPSNLIEEVAERRETRQSLFPVAPLGWLRDSTAKGEQAVYDATGLRLGLTFTHLFQGITDALPGTDSWGTTTDMDIVADWELLFRGEPQAGSLYVHAEGRWDYGTTGPQDLGFVNLASAIGTANSFSEYSPAFLVRNLYWEQGSKKAGWAFRLGKITPDSILATSQHISPVTTFLPNGGTGLFSSGYPDSGLGITGVWYPSDRYRILGLVSDANADRYNFGDITAGNFYVALELGVKIAPRTEKAGYSKLTVWHNDGTKDGQGSNANTGREGWGVTVKLEQELSKDGRSVAILRWGIASNSSSLYDQQAGLSYLFYNPLGETRGLQNDVVGTAFNWADSSIAGARNEYNFELFYRFPMFPGVDTTFSYQAVIDPALNPTTDFASVFSFRLRTMF